MTVSVFIIALKVILMMCTQVSMVLYNVNQAHMTELLEGFHLSSRNKVGNAPLCANTSVNWTKARGDLID